MSAVENRNHPPGIKTMTVAFLLPILVEKNPTRIDPQNHPERRVKIPPVVLVSDESLLRNRWGLAKHHPNPKINEKNEVNLPKRMIAGPRVLYKKTKGTRKLVHETIWFEAVVLPNQSTKIANPPKLRRRNQIPMNRPNQGKMGWKAVVQGNVVVVQEGLMGDPLQAARKQREAKARAVLDAVVVVMKPQSRNVIPPKANIKQPTKLVRKSDDHPRVFLPIHRWIECHVGRMIEENNHDPVKVRLPFQKTRQLLDHPPKSIVTIHRAIDIVRRRIVPSLVLPWILRITRILRIHPVDAVPIIGAIILMIVP